MKFRFPIVILDEDFRSENTSGLGIRALADAMEKEGMEVVGVTSYGDLSQFAQQQSRASAFVLSIDDEEFGAGSVEETDTALKSLRAFVLPAGTPIAASLHLARTVCRRAERSVVHLARAETVPELFVVYLNRLSDLLFTLARLANHRAGVSDVTW